MEQWDREDRLYFPKDKTKRLRRKSYADELKGMPIQNLWTDIPEINSQAQERLGYPTQKPQALLERIISASSNPGDVVLDPFCGCGTTIHAAQKLDRQWIGIDITYLAINLIKRRLKDAFGEEIDFEEKGQPTDFAGAKQLAENDKFQFQHWALSLIGARPLKEGEGKGADRGVDGLLYYYETERKDIPGRVREEPLPRSEPVHREKIIVQIKGGGVNRGDVATLLVQCIIDFVSSCAMTLECKAQGLCWRRRNAGNSDAARGEEVAGPTMPNAPGLFLDWLAAKPIARS